MSNPFQSGLRKLIPATLIYGRYKDQVLMLHRNLRDAKADAHAGKWNGLGGKLELEEDPRAGAKREFKEETGWDLPIEAFVAKGVIQFPNFRADRGEDWLVFIFEAWVSEPRANLKCDEGTLAWIDAREVMGLNLWPGDRLFLPQVLTGDSVIGSVSYEKGLVVRSWVQTLASPSSEMRE